MEHLILAINPGSTSTKVAVYRNTEQVVELTLRHSAELIAHTFEGILDQFDYRKEIIMTALHNAGVDIWQLSAVVGRGGLIKPIKSGVYRVNQAMLDDIRFRPLGQHASNLGALLAYDIAQMAGCEAFIADPVVVDELQEVARITGWKDMSRTSIFHALNQKAIARRYAEEVGRKYEDMNLIVAHLGGGCSVGAHHKGEVIDVNNALEGEGPFSPERVGTIAVQKVVDLCFSGLYSQSEISKLVCGRGGLVDHLGINDAREVERRVDDGDKYAKLIYEAMSYNLGKYIGEMATVLHGKVDAIILTGGIAYSTFVTDYIAKMVSFIAPVKIYAGEDELWALAENALRVLNGTTKPQEYQ